MRIPVHFVGSAKVCEFELKSFTPLVFFKQQDKTGVQFYFAKLLQQRRGYGVQASSSSQQNIRENPFPLSKLGLIRSL